MTSQLKHLLKLRSSLLPNFRQNIRPLSTPVETPKPENAGASLSSKTHKVDNFERKMLVWTGKYKTADEIPTYIK